MSKKEYGVETLQMYEPMQHLREKWFMYTTGVDHIVYEIVSNSIDEAMAGFGKEIIVTLHTDNSVSVRDFGRGIPFANHPKYNMSGIDVALCNTLSGGKMDNTKEGGGYEVSTGSYGVGAKIATATAERMQVDVWRDGKHVVRTYRLGEPVGDLIIEDAKPGDLNGTCIRYQPHISEKLWGDVKFSNEKLVSMLRDQAYLLTGITMTFVNEKLAKTSRFKFENGLLDKVKDMTKDKETIIKNPIRITGDLDGVKNGIDIAFNYLFSGWEESKAFANNVSLSEGGTHVEGFRSGLTRAINEASRTLGVLKPKDDNFSGRELREGLVSVVSAKLRAPKYANQTKTSIENKDIAPKIASFVYQTLKDYFKDNPKEAYAICSHLALQRKVRLAAKKTRDAILNKNSKTSFSSTVGTKLVNCKNKNPKDIELFIVEGSPLNCPR